MNNIVLHLKNIKIKTISIPSITIAMMRILFITKDKLYLQQPWHFRFTNPSPTPASPATSQMSQYGLLLLLWLPSLLLGFAGKTADELFGQSVQLPCVTDSVRVPEVWIDHFPHSVIQEDEEKLIIRSLLICLCVTSHQSYHPGSNLVTYLKEIWLRPL